MKKCIMFMTILVLGMVLFANGAAEEAGEWKPKKPITIVVPTNPGDYYDSQARIIASELEKSLGVSVTIEYMPGAGHALAYEYIQRAPGDGYTLGYCSLTSTVVNQIVYKKNYNFRDWTVFSCCYNQENDPAFLYIPGAATEGIKKYNSWQDVLDKKGIIRWASVGEGSVVHVCGVLLQESYGLNIQQVLGYGGGPDCVTAVARGEAELTTMTIDVCRPFFEAGDVKPLLTVGYGHSTEYPDIPSLSDDFPDLVKILLNKHYVVAPSKMEKRVADVLDKAIWDAMNSNAMKELHKTSISNGKMYLPQTSEEMRESLESVATLIEPLIPVLRGEK